MSDLARRLGVDLVQRANRRCQLTPAGEYLANYVLRAEGMLAEAVRGIRDFAPNSMNVVSLVASGTPGTYWLPAVVAYFTAQHRDTLIEMQIMTTAEAEQAVRAHQVSFGIVGAVHPVSELRSEVLRHDEFVIIGPRSMHGSAPELTQLEEATWIRRKAGAAIREAEETLWRTIGISPKHFIELSSREAVKLTVAAGAGIAACSRMAIEVELKAESLGLITVPTWPQPRDIYLIANRDLPLSPATMQFLDLVRYAAADTLDAVKPTRQGRFDLSGDGRGIEQGVGRQG
jgi:DNA-binding transcriptional LysR family regulator